MKEWFGGIEAGGTKFNCMVASGPGDILAECRISTSDPSTTLPQVVHFFKQVCVNKNIQLTRIGLGFFGPLDLDMKSSIFGSITSTPKLAWRNMPVLTQIQEELGIPACIDTDVNAAAIGEGRWGAAKELNDYIYVTIGTGIGGGVICGGKPVHGLVHPEIGHILLPHDLQKDPFPGNCPYHKDCWEGLAAGPALEARWHQPAEQLPPEHPAWNLEAEYIAAAVHNMILTLSPKRIILGGGVMKQPGLIEKIRIRAVHLLNHYVDSAALREGLDQYIVTPALGDRAGILGCIALAMSLN